jgi:hypothetical protein
MKNFTLTVLGDTFELEIRDSKKTWQEQVIKSLLLPYLTRNWQRFLKHPDCCYLKMRRTFSALTIFEGVKRAGI